MSYPKLNELVQKVYKATSLGVVQWKDTEFTDVYQISFSSYSVRIGERVSRADSVSSEYYLTVLNDDGDVIEDIGDEDGDDQQQRTTLFRILKETFEVARRQAKGVDQALDSILADIDFRLP